MSESKVILDNTERIHGVKLKKWQLAGILLFFLGFPFFGLLFFWSDVHGRIKRDAEPAAFDIVTPILTHWQPRSIESFQSPYTADVPLPAMLEDYDKRLGAMQELGRPEDSRTWTTERDQQVWQFAEFTYDPTFERQQADVIVVVSRPYLDTEWKLESLRIDMDS